MKPAVRERKRNQAQEIMWDAMEAASYDDVIKAEALCRRALTIYSDCVDALAMLAVLESELDEEYVEKLREAVEAGRRDLGPEYFRDERGSFWGLIETRPFMRTLAHLGQALLDFKTPERTDEAIGVFEEMLDLNPNDNQGVRDMLAGSYLARKRYDDTSALFDRYPEDWLAAQAWAKVLLAFATEGEDAAAARLAEARARNPHVEAYLTGRKRRPREGDSTYSPGDESEAAFCADTLWEAWKAHPKAKKWLKEAGEVTA